MKNLVLTCVFALAVGCDISQRSPTILSMTANDSSLQIALETPAALRRVAIVDDEGATLLELPVAGVRREYELPVDWTSLAGMKSCRAKLVFDSTTLERELSVPSPPPAIRALLELPFGQDSIELGDNMTAAVLTPREGELPLGVTIECRRQGTVNYRFTLTLPPGVSLASTDERWQRAGDAWQLTGMLKFAGDYVQVLGTLRYEPTPNDLKRELLCTLAFGDSAGNTASARLAVSQLRLDPAQLARQITIEQVAFPADLAGARRPERLSDAVVLPNPAWSWLRGLFRSSATLVNYYDAYGYQAVTIRNSGDVPLNLLIESEVRDAKTGTPLADFAPPEWKSPRVSATSEHLLRVPSRSAATAVIPLYVRPNAPPGEYVRRLRAFVAGQRSPAATIDLPLVVMRGDPWVSAAVLASLALCAGGWIAAGMFGKRATKCIGLEGLVVIGLMSAVHFGVSYAANLSGSVLSGLLGPLAVFVSGLGHEGLTSLVLAATIVLVPRRGAFALSSATVCLLNALVQGQFGLLDVLFVTVSATLGELCLAALRVTQGGEGGPSPDRSTAFVWRLALALGIANLLALTSQFCLVQVLYRLFFADWYVLAVAVLTGLVYGTAGAAWGARLGLQLRRTAR